MNNTEAKDAMCALFTAAWLAQTPAIVGTPPKIVYPWDTERSITNEALYWGRISFTTVLENQATYRGPMGSPRRWRVEGLVTVQIFAPMSDIQGARNLEKLADIARSSFRGAKAGDCVWFRRPRIQELDPDGKWHRANAIAVFQYDDIR